MTAHLDIDVDVERVGEEEDQVSLAEFFGCLLKVIRFLRLYPSDHPFISRSLDDLRELWAFVQDAQPDFTFESRTGSIFSGGSEIEHAPRSLAPLKRMLVEKNLEGFAIDRSAEFEELRDLAGLLARPRHEVIEKNRIKPVHLIGLKGVRLNGRGARVPSGSDASGFSSGSSSRALLSSLLSRSLAEPTGALVALAKKITRHILDRTPIAFDELDLRTTLKNRPGVVSYAVAVAVNELLMGAENPSPDDLRSAFSHALEPLVAARLEGEAGGFRLMETTVRTVLAPYDRQFIRRFLQESPDGSLAVDPILARFSASLKLEVLKTELLDPKLETAGFRRMLEAVGADEPDRNELLSRLTRTVAEGPEFKSSYARVARIIGSAGGARHRDPVIIVLDPDVESSGRVRRELAPLDVDLHVVSEGQALLGEVDRLHPDAIIVEPRLRDVSGLELISELRRTAGSREPTPLIVFTDAVSYANEFEVRAHPCCRFVLKEEGSEVRVREAIEEILKRPRNADAPRRRTGAVDYRPVPEFANSHFFLPRFEIQTFHQGVEAGAMAFFDFVPVDESRTVVLLAEGFRHEEDEDSCAEIRERIRRLMARDSDPERLLRGLNGLFLEHFRGRPVIAAHALLLDSARGTITGGLAGGVKPLKVSAGGDAIPVAISTALVLGFTRGAPFDSTVRESVLPIGAGETLVLGSRGLMEDLGDGDAERALSVIGQEMSIAVGAARAVASPLPVAVRRIADALPPNDGAARDRAVLLIRCLAPGTAPLPEPEPEPVLVGAGDGGRD